MEFKKKTIIWEDNNEPPKDYIWVKSDGKAYEFSYTTREWKEIMSSGGSGDCDPCEGGSSTTEFSSLTRNGKTVQESDLSDGDVVKPLYAANYSGPNKGDLVSAKMVNGKLEQTFVDDPDDYVVDTYEKCGETYSVLEKKVIPLNCIYYTTISGNAIDTSASTLAIVSNTYQNGQGIITFESEFEGAPFSETFFSLNNDLLTVELPDGIISIGQRVFDKCKKLEKVRFPKGLQSIGAKAFNECNSLKEINLPESLNFITEGAFRRCYALKEVVIPENVNLFFVENDYSGTFQDCTGLESITLPHTLTVLPRDIFDNCSSLKSIYIPKSVDSIYNLAKNLTRPAFNACSGLTEIVVDPRNQKYFSAVNCEEHNGIFEDVELIRGCGTTTIPDSITTIGFGAFSGCQGLTHIDLPDTITTLKSWCFTMTGLESIVIPKNVEELDAWCFANCPKMESMVVDSDNQTYTSRDGQGNECNCIIGAWSAYNDTPTLISGCKNTTIPSNITRIGGGAFNNQSEMTSLTIPSNIVVISDDEVLNGCSALEDIYYEGTIAQFNEIKTGTGAGADAWYPWGQFLVPVTMVVHCTDGDITKPNE